MTNYHAYNGFSTTSLAILLLVSRIASSASIPNTFEKVGLGPKPRRFNSNNHMNEGLEIPREQAVNLDDKEQTPSVRSVSLSVTKTKTIALSPVSELEYQDTGKKRDWQNKNSLVPGNSLPMMDTPIVDEDSSADVFPSSGQHEQRDSVKPQRIKGDQMFSVLGRQNYEQFDEPIQMKAKGGEELLDGQLDDLTRDLLHNMPFSNVSGEVNDNEQDESNGNEEDETPGNKVHRMAHNSALSFDMPTSQVKWQLRNQEVVTTQRTPDSSGALFPIQSLPTIMLVVGGVLLVAIIVSSSLVVYIVRRNRI